MGYLGRPYRTSAVIQCALCFFPNVLCSFRVFDSDEISLQITLFIAGVFGIAAGGAPNFVAYAALVACLGFGTGGK
jgi:hypothetical protein